MNVENIKILIFKYLPLAIILLLTITLRYVNLGYSEFQDDEKKAFIRLANDETTINFFLTQRKGPMQYFVTSISQLVIQDTKNEFWVRFPFTTMNLMSAFVLYLLLSKITKNKHATLFATLFYVINGFIVGFSRIAQYQNLNLLFSLLAIYFYYHLIEKDTKLFRYSLLGTLSFCVSLLSHWDAIYIIPIVTYVFIKFLKRLDLSGHYKKRILLYNFLLGCIVLLPVLIPYFHTYTNNISNQEYFDKRLGFNSYPIQRHLYIFELYNPFLAFPVYLFILLLSLVFIKKTYPYLIWFIFSFASIAFFMEKPGTHIYNYLLPIIFLSAIVIHQTYLDLKKNARNIKYTLFGVLVIIISFLYIQSYIIFVDNSLEYPWEEKKILFFQTTKYVDKEILTFGFPHYRSWKEVAKIIDHDPNNCSYITNEGKEISQVYVLTKYGLINDGRCYYIADVTKPFISTRDKIVFPKVNDNRLVYKYQKDGRTLLKLYKIE